MLIQTNDKPLRTWHISVHNVDCAPVPRDAQHLVLSINDTLNSALPSHIRQVLDFVSGLGPSDDLGVSCDAGHSRSPAIALGVYMAWGLPLAQALNTLPSRCSPNPHIVKLFALALGQDAAKAARALARWRGAALFL